MHLGFRRARRATVCKQSSSLQTFTLLCRRGINAADLGPIGQTCSAEVICGASHSIRTVSYSIRIVVRDFQMRRSYRGFPLSLKTANIGSVACSRHCETLFHRGTPGVLATHPRSARFCPLFSQHFPSPSLSWDHLPRETRPPQRSRTENRLFGFRNRLLGDQPSLQ